MTTKGEYVIIAGKKFSVQEYEFLLTRFKEAFSHSSLSIEKAFEELEKYNILLEKSMDKEAYEYFSLLSKSKKRKIREILHQIIVYKASVCGVINEQLTGDSKQIEKIYQNKFKYFEPYIYYYAAFDENGDFDKIETFHKIDSLFINLPHRRKAYKTAVNMKKDNLNAFDYAMSLSEIGISDVIDINTVVNYSDENRVIGYKTTNNDIIAAPFTPTDKRYVGVEMQKLFEDYRDDFGLTILDSNEENITNEERIKRSYDLFKREAIFHIRFERIHPFADGNGRTGRIIINYNLINNGQAPVLITDVMSEDYKNFINNYDVEGLTKFLMMSSSQQLTTWISLCKAGLPIRKNSIHPDNDKLAELEEFADDERGPIKIKK